MKTFIHAIIIFVVIFVGNMVAPQYINCEDWKQAVIATVAIVGFVIGIIGAIIGNAVSIVIADRILDGFEIKTVGAYIVVLILMTVFSIRINLSKSNSNN